MKKVLALVVAFALCFTVFAGCFATSAAAVADFAVVGSTVEAAGGAATVTVSGTYTEKTVQLLTVTLPEGLTFVSVNGMTELTVDGDDGDYVVNGQVVKFLDVYTGAFSIVINVTAAANAAETDATYTVAASAEIADFDDDASTVVEANGAVTVKGVAPAGPVLDENLQFRDILVTVTSTVNIRYRIYRNTTNGINGFASLGYSSVGVVVSGKEYSFETANLYNEVDIPETDATTTNGTTFLFEGIGMCSLGLNIDAYIKAYDAEGNFVAYSPVTTSSPEALLKTNLANTTTVAGKTAITELLNMAAAAQVQFAANKAGTDLAAAVAEGKLVNKDLDDTYTISELPTLNDVNNIESVNADFVTAHKISSTVSLTKSPNIRVYVGSKNSLDMSKIKVDFTYFDPDPNVKTTVTKTIDGSTAEGQAAIGTSGARWTFDIPGFEFHNSNQTVTADVYYDVDGNGTLEKVAVVSYSVETYLGSQLASASASQVAKDMATAIAKFGLAFRNNKGITA